MIIYKGLTYPLNILHGQYWQITDTLIYQKGINCLVSIPWYQLEERKNDAVEITEIPLDNIN